MPSSDEFQKELDSFVREWTRKSPEEHARIPEVDEVAKAWHRAAGSPYPVRPIGFTSDSFQVALTEADRESHIHILGAPGEGKSKFIELLMRQDIDSGYGCCLLDPSRSGDTYYSVLKYCISKGVEKVLLIDPHDAIAFSKVAGINPIHYDAPGNVVAEHVMDTIRILWGSRAEETPKINKYLPAILRVLKASGMTLYEALYFTNRDFRYRPLRERMLEMWERTDGELGLHPHDQHRVLLENVFSHHAGLFSSEMDSTARRLNPFFDETLRLFIARKNQTVDFKKLIAEKWVILVNLDPKRVWGTEQQRLLGTLVVNELVEAASALVHHGWKGRHYLYIDEVGRFATRKLSDALDYDRHLNIGLTLAHQRFNQIEDEHVLSAIKTGAKIKVLFNTPSREDRDLMVRMMYGGDIPDKQASYELGQLKKQYAAIKINKQPPRITRLPDVPEVEIPAAVIADYKRKLYLNEWYASPAEVLDEINERFTEAEFIFARQPTKKASGNKPHKRVTKPTVEQKRGSGSKRQDTGGVLSPTVPDDSAGSASVLFKKTGRTTRRIPKV